MPRSPAFPSVSALGFATLALLLDTVPSHAASVVPHSPPGTERFLEKHCTGCHDDVEKKGGLDLTALTFAPSDPKNFNTWVKVFDRVADGEMPPKKKPRPEAAESAAFTQGLSKTLANTEHARVAAEGRATQRRLNRYEYEHALRDLLHAPWLQVKDSLPEDGEAFRFNKVGDALDMSHVQMNRYLAAADYALRQVIAPQVERPQSKITRYYAREQRSFMGPMKFSVFNSSPERASFPMLGDQPQPDVRAGKAAATVGAADAVTRDLEAVGVVASNYEPIEPKFNQFKAPLAGRYKIRFNTFSVWVGPGKATPDKNGKLPSPANVKWWIPDLDEVTTGRRSEPVTIYSELPPRLLRHLGNFDAQPTPAVTELDVWLLAGETIRPDPSRLFRSRPGAARWQNPLAEKDGQPGVAFRWLEVEGPLTDEWPSAGHRRLFGNLPIKQIEKPTAGTAPVEVTSADPAKDAARLLTAFVEQAYRRPVAPGEVQRFLPVVAGVLKSGGAFADAMITGYTAVLCSPEFVCLEEKPGQLDVYAVASRLAFFLTNSAPDAELRALAAKGTLDQPAVLRAQTERLLNSPKSPQFVNAFLDYWLDLRKTMGTAPDSSLYDDYYLDDLLTESALGETQKFFAELVRANLPARHIVASDFAMVNERLALHYGLPTVEGVALRRVPIPANSPRGGLMTQASVLKVTANGTTTSPILRGVWVLDRILGRPVPPPPPNVPAVEPDIRGATTIRDQLAKHRATENCAGCHARIDPPGFALENYDVIGGWREKYRIVADAKNRVNNRTGPLGKYLKGYEFGLGLPVDAGDVLPDGRKFADVTEFKQLLLANPEQIARCLTEKLVTYATGQPVGFGDHAAVGRILTEAKRSDYGLRSLVHAVVGSELFRSK